ncbi:hypothetical protein QJQ45_019174 [Haematococcus lacustris]|nr:hypothetical protein QJQ45_019174 [Haematococcus lacustris]
MDTLHAVYIASTFNATIFTAAHISQIFLKTTSDDVVQPCIKLTAAATPTSTFHVPILSTHRKSSPRLPMRLLCSRAQLLQRRVAVSAPFLWPLTCYATVEVTPEAATTSVKVRDNDVCIEVDELCSGKVTKMSPEMVCVTLDNNVPASLHISMISRDRVDDIGEVFAVGDVLKAVVVSITKRMGIKLSTKALELVPGQMKTKKQAVFANADKGLAQYLVSKNEIMDQRRQALSRLQVGSIVTGTTTTRRKDGWLVMLDGVAALVRNYDKRIKRGQSVQILITSIEQKFGLVYGTTRYEKNPHGTYQPLPRLRAKSTETTAGTAPAAQLAAQPAAQPAVEPAVEPAAQPAAQPVSKA